MEEAFGFAANLARGPLGSILPDQMPLQRVIIQTFSIKFLRNEFFSENFVVNYVYNIQSMKKLIPHLLSVAKQRAVIHL